MRILHLSLSLQTKLFLAFVSLAILTAFLAAASIYLVPHWSLLLLFALILLPSVIAYFAAAYFHKHIDQLVKNSIAQKSTDEMINRLASPVHNFTLTGDYEREFMLIPAIRLRKLPPLSGIIMPAGTVPATRITWPELGFL